MKATARQLDGTDYWYPVIVLDCGHERLLANTMRDSMQEAILFAEGVIQRCL